MAAYKKLMLHDNSVSETTDTVEQKPVESQVDKFSTDYTADKFNELCNEFDSITLDTDTSTITKDDAKDVASVSARAKLFLISSCVVLSLVLFLFIYNFVVINQMQNSINILQSDASYQEYQVSQKESRVNELTDDETLKAKLNEMGFSENVSENTVTIPTGQGYNLTVDSNWFDRFCNFISSIFGG